MLPILTHAPSRRPPRQVQYTRIRREESLAGLRVELTNGKLVPLGRLRSFGRPVLVIGTPEHVRASVQAAEEFRPLLEASGVVLVPLPLYGDGPSALNLPPAAADGSDRRWRVTPARLDEWRAWTLTQLETAGKNEADGAARGLFVGLRLDGRVRSSGLGCRLGGGTLRNSRRLRGRGPGRAGWTVSMALCLPFRDDLNGTGLYHSLSISSLYFFLPASSSDGRGPQGATIRWKSSWRVRPADSFSAAER